MLFSANASSPGFYGATVVRAACVLAMFGWGIGFYGPPIFLHAVVARTGWSLSLVSAAVTTHFLLGACVVAGLPRLHQRAGIAATTAGGAIALALGSVGWALAAEPWQLFAAAALTGAGWVPLGAAALNAIIAPWFVRRRPIALAQAYNGASFGGVVFSPLWVALIGHYGFVAATLTIGAALLAVVLPLAIRVLAKTPADLGQRADGDGADADPVPAASTGAARLPVPALWRDRRFVTLAAAMALSLFAQIGLIAQLYGLMVPALGPQQAGWLMAMATACSIGGRSLVARLLGPAADRRRAACASHAIQATGTLLLLFAAPQQLGWIVLGVALFGLGIGNATSLPPLIAQQEFARDEVPRVVARCVALAQACYAFAPAAFSLLLARGGTSTPAIGQGTLPYFTGVLVLQLLSIGCLLAGRRQPPPRLA